MRHFWIFRESFHLRLQHDWPVTREIADTSSWNMEQVKSGQLAPQRHW